MSLSDNPAGARPGAPQRRGMPVSRQLLLWGCVLLAFLLLTWLLKSVLLPFLVGAAVAYFLDPGVRQLERLGLPRTLAAALMTFFALGLLLATLIGVVPMLVVEAGALWRELPDLLERGKSLIDRHVAGADLDNENSPLRQFMAQAGEALRENTQVILAGLFMGVSGLVSLVLFWVIMPVVAFYLLIDWQRLVAAIDDLAPREHVLTIRGLASDVDSTIAGFLRGQLVVCLILAAYYAIGLTLAGLGYGLVIGVVAGFISFVPYIGALVGGMLAIGLALYQFWGDPWAIGLVVGIFLFGQFLESNVLVPRLVGQSVNLHPVWLIFAVMAFGTVFGLVGALIAVPLAATLGVFARFMIDRYRKSSLYQGEMHLSEFE